MASNPPYTSNLDAAPTAHWRPIHHTTQIWTPRQPPTGVQSALHLKSGRRANTHWRPIRPTPTNLDAAPTTDWRPIRPRFPIWTPRQHPTGVHSALHPQIWTPPQPVSGVQSTIQPKSGRRANTQQASIPPYISNLDAAPTTHWRPFRHTTPIWTPPQPVSGVLPPIPVPTSPSGVIT